MATAEAQRVRFLYDDGGRAAAGFSSHLPPELRTPDAEEAGDCAVRALAIALELDYGQLHAMFAGASGGDPGESLPYDLLAEFLHSMGWHHTANDEGLTVSDLPAGRYIVEYNMSCSGEMLHCSALIDRELRDIPPLGMPEEDARQLGLCDVDEWPVIGWWQPGRCGGDVASPEQRTAAGQDAMFLLKKAYERDWMVIRAPRDVIERGTSVWVPTTVDDFPAASHISGSTLTTPYGTWTIGIDGSNSSASVLPSGGVQLKAQPASPPSGTSVTIATPAVTVERFGAGTGGWRMQASFSSIVLGAGSSVGDDSLSIQVTESSGDQYGIELLIAYPNNALTGILNFTPSGGGTEPIDKATIAGAAMWTFMLESDDEWVFGFINGQLLGAFRRNQQLTTSLQTSITAQSVPAFVGATLNGLLAECITPFLMPGSRKGDYALPGTGHAG